MEVPANEIPLNQANLEDILKELDKRYTGVLVVTHGKNLRDSDIEENTVYYTHSLMLAVGMSTYAKEFLSNAIFS